MKHYCIFSQKLELSFKYIYCYLVLFSPAHNTNYYGLPCLGSSDGKESACSTGDLDSIPGLERSPGGGHGNPLQYSCLENSQGQRSLVCYSPWNHKESDTTE